MIRSILMFIVILVTSLHLEAQDVQNSRKVSQRASTTQRIGTTDVTIVYHRPLANGRKVFGGIVPYDFVVDGKEYAWRAGSNQRTTIEFTHDVTIEGKKLPAGKYGLVVLVSKEEWTFVFSSNMSWGSFQYDPKNDVLRVKVKTEPTPYQNWLSYNYVDPQPESVGVELSWEETKATFQVRVDVNANILSDLENKENKTSDDYRTMATELLVKDPSKVAEALELIEESIARLDSVDERYRPSETFASNIMKADLLIQSGKKKEGSKLKKKTIESATGFNLYYYGLNTLIVKDDKEEAYRILSQAVKDYPDNWTGFLALGEYYLKDGDQAKVVENFKLAYEKAPDNWKNYARYLYLMNEVIME